MLSECVEELLHALVCLCVCVCVCSLLYSPNTWEIDKGGERVQGSSWLCREFEANVGYLRASLSIKKKKKEKKNLDFWLFSSKT